MASRDRGVKEITRQEFASLKDRSISKCPICSVVDEATSPDEVGQGQGLVMMLL